MPTKYIVPATRFNWPATKPSSWTLVLLAALLALVSGCISPEPGGLSDEASPPSPLDEQAPSRAPLGEKEDAQPEPPIKRLWTNKTYDNGLPHPEYKMFNGGYYGVILTDLAGQDILFRSLECRDEEENGRAMWFTIWNRTGHKMMHEWSAICGEEQLGSMTIPPDPPYVWSTFSDCIPAPGQDGARNCIEAKIPWYPVPDDGWCAVYTTNCTEESHGHSLSDYQGRQCYTVNRSGCGTIYYDTVYVDAGNLGGVTYFELPPTSYRIRIGGGSPANGQVEPSEGCQGLAYGNPPGRQDVLDPTGRVLQRAGNSQVDGWHLDVQQLSGPHRGQYQALVNLSRPSAQDTAWCFHVVTGKWNQNITKLGFDWDDNMFGDVTFGPREQWVIREFPI